MKQKEKDGKIRDVHNDHKMGVDMIDHHCMGVFQFRFGGVI